MLRSCTAIDIIIVNRFALGEYFPANESWVTDVQSATIDSGPNSNWEYAGFVGAVKTDNDKRFMNIGCASAVTRSSFIDDTVSCY